jgi:hypothetical protein
MTENQMQALCLLHAIANENVHAAYEIFEHIISERVQELAKKKTTAKWRPKAPPPGKPAAPYVGGGVLIGPQSLEP